MCMAARFWALPVFPATGQKELLEAIAGLQHTESGSDVKFFAPGEEDKPMELLGKSPKDIRDAGVHLSFVRRTAWAWAWLAPWA